MRGKAHVRGKADAVHHSQARGARGTDSPHTLLRRHGRRERVDAHLGKGSREQAGRATGPSEKALGYQKRRNRPGYPESFHERTHKAVMSVFARRCEGHRQSIAGEWVGYLWVLGRVLIYMDHGVYGYIGGFHAATRFIAA